MVYKTSSLGNTIDFCWTPPVIEFIEDNTSSIRAQNVNPINEFNFVPVIQHFALTYLRHVVNEVIFGLEMCKLNSSAPRIKLYAVKNQDDQLTWFTADK